MTDQLDSGLSLRDDIAFIRTDPDLHDVTIVCSDGVEIGACRAILASRSPFFKAMFHGNMKEATSNKVTLHDIKSATLHAVLRFIHTEDIDSTAISVAIDVYCAATFLLLPKLMKLVPERAHDIDSFEIATSLLNEATVSLPWNEITKDLYKVLLKPFYIHSLDIGDLNGLSEDALELLLTKSNKFNTSEYDLLLCIVEWAWERNATAQSAEERRTIFDAINLMPTKPSAKILLKNGPSHTSLLKMMQHVDFSLICPHRLKSLTEAVDVLTETSPQYLTFCHYTYKNTQCLADHPSDFRGTPTTRFKFQWDQSKLGVDLVLSEEDTVVEFPAFSHIARAVRALTPCVARPDGVCEWDIVVESMGSLDDSDLIALGLISENFNNFNAGLVAGDFGFQCFRDNPFIVDNGVMTSFGRQIQQGDVITFHLELNNGTGTMLINGHNYGAVWTNLPRNSKVYFAVNLAPNAKYRIKPHIRS